jgi:hypothetical protein
MRFPKNANVNTQTIYNSVRNWKPIFVEDSKIPVWLSKIAPIEINAITLGIIVFSRSSLPEHVRRHETIHFQQFLETLFIPFVLIYFYDYIKNYFLHRNGPIAYRNIRAEKEAYLNAGTVGYLNERQRYKWLLRK